MGKEIRLLVKDSLYKRSFLAIRKIRDGISVLLSDDSFIAEGDLKARLMIWNVDNRVPYLFSRKHNPKTDLPVKNPHFSYHPPSEFHLTSNKGMPYLYRGIMHLELMLHQETVIPWLKIVTKPVSRMSPYFKERACDHVTEVSQDCSLEIAVDILKEKSNDYVLQIPLDLTKTSSIDWGNEELISTAYFSFAVKETEPQEPTLAWASYH